MGSCMSANRSENKVTPGEANGPGGYRSSSNNNFIYKLNNLESLITIL